MTCVNINKKKQNIEKFSGYLLKSEGGFTTFINSSFHLINDAFAAGIYVYLLSLPPDWKLNPQQLAKHYNCSKNTIYKALTFLKDLHLLTREDLRESGRFVRFHYMVHLSPNIPTESQCEKGISPVPKKPELVKPELIKSDTYKINNIKNKDYRNTTTVKSVKSKKVSSSSSIINEKVDSEILTHRDTYILEDKRTDEEFLKQCSHHLDNGNKDKYSFSARLKGLKTIIEKGFFEVPPGYRENKVIKSQFSPEEVALMAEYRHFSNIPKANIEKFMTAEKIQSALKLLEKEKLTKGAQQN